MKIIIAVDNSNIHVSTINNYGLDARFSYSNLEKIFYSENNIVAKYIAGSTPPASDAFWKKMKRDGYNVTTYERVTNYYGGTKEKGVDGIPIADGTEAIVIHKPDLLVLLSGDLDMRALVDKAHKYNCIVHAWAYKEAISSDFAELVDEVFYIDDYLNELLYFQCLDGAIETYVERNKRLSREREEAAQKREKERLMKEEEKRIKQEKKRQKRKDGKTWPAVLLGVGSTALAVVGAVIISIIRGGKDD